MVGKNGGQKTELKPQKKSKTKRVIAENSRKRRKHIVENNSSNGLHENHRASEKQARKINRRWSCRLSRGSEGQEDQKGQREGQEREAYRL